MWECLIRRVWWSGVLTSDSFPFWLWIQQDFWKNIAKKLFYDDSGFIFLRTLSLYYWFQNHCSISYSKFRLNFFDETGNETIFIMNFSFSQRKKTFQLTKILCMHCPHTEVFLEWKMHWASEESRPTNISKRVSATCHEKCYSLTGVLFIYHRKWVHCAWSTSTCYP